MTAPPVRPALTSRHSNLSFLGSPANTNPTLNQGNIGATVTLIDLLNASAHDPDLEEHDSESEESYSDHEDDSSELPSPISPSPSTQAFSTSNSSSTTTAGRPLPRTRASSIHPHDYVPSVESTTPGGTVAPEAPPRRGSISYTGLTPHESQLATELALESLDAADQAIGRAQDDRLDAEEFRDPQDLEKEGEEKQLTDKESLARLVEEFGPWSDDSERFEVQIPGALYRGVLIKGLLALTNRRLFIYAFIPPAESIDKVIKSGPVSVTLPGKLSKKHRCWLELRSDSLSWFRSSTETYKPIGACRLSGIKEILPYEADVPQSVGVSLIDGRTRAFELDTAESAIRWRAELEAAVFTFRATADKLRLSLPLQYVTGTTVEPFHAMAVRVQLHFDPTPAPNCNPSAEVAEDSSSVNDADTQTSKTEQVVEFGYLRSHETFSRKLLSLVDEAKELPPCGAVVPILEIDSTVRKADIEEQTAIASDSSLGAQFCRMFALADNPADLFIVNNVELIRALPAWGNLVIGAHWLCFWRKATIGADIKMRIPLIDIDDAVAVRAFGFRIFGLSIQIHGAPDCRLDFVSRKARDSVIDKIKSSVLAFKVANVALSASTAASETSTPLISPSKSISEASSMTPSSPTTPGGSHYAQAEKPHLFALGQDLHEQPITIEPGSALQPIPKILGTQTRRKVAGLHFVCLTIGSRGDVQPYIALGKELMKDGNRVTIASHPEYREWVEGYGIGYQEVGGDPAALMKLSVEHKMFSPGFFKESLGHFRKWLDDLFHECWLACQTADILLESPSTMAGIHVAEALGIPYMRCFTMPWTQTSTYPQAFAAGADLGPTYNSLSYSIFDSIMWKATSGQVNRWRKKELGLRPTSEHKMSQAKVPFIYNFSSAIVPKPNDWKDHIFISGYWFLQDDKPWDPPAGLLEFIAKARADGKPVIYVGFGSIVVSDAAAVTRAVSNAVINADVRAILSKGWSERGADKHEEVELPEEIFSVPSVAHDHLFPLIDAACHHGGAGTTGASLRAGLPTLIHPFFGDQFFWASRVQKLGAGVRVDSLDEKELTRAFKLGTTDRVIREKAQACGERIRSEHGQRNALDFIYDHIHLAQERADLRAARAAGNPKLKQTSTSLSASSLIPRIGRTSTKSTTKSAFPPTEWLDRSRSSSRERVARSQTLPAGEGTGTETRIPTKLSKTTSV